MTSVDPSIVRFRDLVAAATAHVESRKQEINDLNVFPVADGDTGDNMALTLRSVVEELDAVLTEGLTLDADGGREELVRRLARAALLGARGNSGVILSQLIRGAAEELVARPGELIRPPLVAAALAGASHRGYDSVRQPVEGTILTVVREMAGAASHAVAQLDPGQLGAPAGDAEQSFALAIVIGEAIAAGLRALDEGPELLPALKDAGVVDAGGFGLLVLFAGVIRFLREGQPGGDFDIRHYAAARLEGLSHASETFRYCTNFAVTGAGLDAGRVRDDLATMGDSIIVVVGDEQTLKIHVHTDEPDRAMALFDGTGEVSRVDVADMEAQVAARTGRSAAAAEALVAAAAVREHSRSAVLAVVSGAGLVRAFAQEGAVVVDGGLTMNPSTADLLEAIEGAPADEIVLLPNNGNVLMAAERAAELASKPVVVVPTRSQQAGLASLGAALDDGSASESAASLTAELDELLTAGVAPAARADPAGRFDVGDALGYVGEDLVAWGTPQDVLRTVLAQACEDGRELVVLAAGDGAPLEDDVVSGLAPDGSEPDVLTGGQPAWWWLVATG
ncbi:DAK2 domain-containing protein [Patulibacter sp.]|uniref:DAK2 domain-containing protein n=1 Tax=Patulibacter sp. TaxID=1912859 RepID=UPI00271F1CF3|nr:DAK2 domain-containing protein [Patulibacter sp.]MDO9409940.1 DAK2 domain-containing protein [Patulibacter sp.]